MTIYLWLPAFSLLLLGSCMRGEGKDLREYDPASNLEEATVIVLAKQNIGEIMSNFERDEEYWELRNGALVRFVRFDQQDCVEPSPPTSPSPCSTYDSSELGLPDHALVSTFSQLRGSIRDQGSRGTCVAFSLVAALEAVLDYSVDLSEQHLYLLGKQIECVYNSDYCTEEGQGGGLWPGVTLDGLDNGLDDEVYADQDQPRPIATEAEWPYNKQSHDCTDYSATYPSFQCSETEGQGTGAEGQGTPGHVSGARYVVTGWEELGSSVGRIKQALADGYPVLITVDVDSDFYLGDLKQGVISNVFTADACTLKSCGHAVLAIAYQDDADVEGGGFVVIKNSWGEDWGDGGLAYATYQWLTNNLTNAHAIKSASRN